MKRVLLFTLLFSSFLSVAQVPAEFFCKGEEVAVQVKNTSSSFVRRLVFGHPYIAGFLVAASLGYVFRKQCVSLWDNLSVRLNLRPFLNGIREPSSNQALQKGKEKAPSVSSTSYQTNSSFRIALTQKNKLPVMLVPGELYQIESLQQQAAECGCYAKYNALAVASLIEQNQVVTPQAVKDRVAQLVAVSGVQNWVEEDIVFTDLAAALPGGNVYMLKLSRMNDGKTIQIEAAGTTFDAHAFTMENFWLTMCRQDAQGVGYFIINLDYSNEEENEKEDVLNGHWVLVVACKQLGLSGPYFLYFDSQNNPINEHPYASVLIPYFRGLAANHSA